MALLQKKLQGVLLGSDTQHAQLERARALDAYLGEVEQHLSDGDVPSAQALVARMRRFVALVTTENGPA